MRASDKHHGRAKGEGKRIRRARNIVKRFDREYGDCLRPDCELAQAIKHKRYQRAVAILVSSALVESK